MKSSVTIYQVAEAAGVSSTTVYKALNGKPKVSEETRDTVLAIAKEMGYKANKVAQTLKRKEIKIGVVIEKYFPGYNDDIIRGMNDAFEDLYDYKFWPVYNSFEDSYDEKNVINDFNNIVNKNVDAFILCLASEKYVPIINKLSDQGIPSLLITTDLKGCKKISVIRQNANIVGKIGAQLLNLVNKDGYNAIILGNKDNITHKEIFEGFYEEQKKTNSKIVGVFESQDDDNIAYYVTERILNEYPHTNGIFVCNAVSQGVCKKIIERGLGQKIKIICTDTYPQILDHLETDMIQATIFQDPYLQGKLAVRTIYKYLVENKKPEETTFINPRIVLKSNCRNFY